MPVTVSKPTEPSDVAADRDCGRTSVPRDGDCSFEGSELLEHGGVLWDAAGDDGGGWSC